MISLDVYSDISLRNFLTLSSDLSLFIKLIGVDEFLSSIVQEKFDVKLDFEDITSKIGELKKLKEIL